VDSAPTQNTELIRLTRELSERLERLERLTADIHGKLVAA
jgi:hypothetical protein